MIEIEKIDAKVSFSKIFQQFESERHVFKNDSNILFYYVEFISWLEENRYEKYKRVFLKETTLEEFIMSHFLEFPISLLYNKIMFRDEIVKIINRHNTEIHSNIDMLCKLMSFYEIPKLIIDMYDEVLPNYFDKSNPQRDKFLWYFFTYQKVPQKYFSRSLDFIKTHKDIIHILLFSNKSKFYMNNVFEYNPGLYRELKSIVK